MVVYIHLMIMIILSFNFLIGIKLSACFEQLCVTLQAAVYYSAAVVVVFVCENGIQLRHRLLFTKISDSLLLLCVLIIYKHILFSFCVALDCQCVTSIKYIILRTISRHMIIFVFFYTNLCIDCFAILINISVIK